MEGGKEEREGGVEGPFILQAGLGTWPLRVCPEYPGQQRPRWKALAHPGASSQAPAPNSRNTPAPCPRDLTWMRLRIRKKPGLSNKCSLGSRAGTTCLQFRHQFGRKGLTRTRTRTCVLNGASTSNPLESLKPRGPTSRRIPFPHHIVFRPCEQIPRLLSLCPTTVPYSLTSAA